MWGVESFKVFKIVLQLVLFHHDSIRNYMTLYLILWIYNHKLCTILGIIPAINSYILIVIMVNIGQIMLIKIDNSNLYINARILIVLMVLK